LQVSIASRTSPAPTPKLRASIPVAFAAPEVSTTRRAAFANMPSTTRRIAPNSSTTRTAASGDNAAASNDNAISSNELRAATIEANMCSYRRAEV